jgi:transcriptional regulator with XRE-family HTH domain
LSKVKLSIGKTIREARIASNLSQMKLAEKVGLSYQQIQKYEKGASELSLTRLFQIAEALELPLDTFFRRKELTVAEPPSLYGKISNEEESLLRLYRKVGSAKKKKLIISLLKVMAERE